MAGGFAVDVFLLLSGLLLGLRLPCAAVPVIGSTVRRLCRLWPTMLLRWCLPSRYSRTEGWSRQPIVYPCVAAACHGQELL